MALSIQEIQEMRSSADDGPSSKKQWKRKGNVDFKMVVQDEGCDNAKNVKGSYFQVLSASSNPKPPSKFKSGISSSRPPYLNSPSSDAIPIPPPKLSSLLTTSKPLTPVLSTMSPAFKTFCEEDEEPIAGPSTSLISSFSTTSSTVTITEEDEEEVEGDFEFSPPSMGKRRERAPLFNDEDDLDINSISLTVENFKPRSRADFEKRGSSTLLADLFNIRSSIPAQSSSSLASPKSVSLLKKSSNYSSYTSLPSHSVLHRPKLPQRSSSSPSVPSRTSSSYPPPSKVTNRRKTSIATHVALDPLICPEDEYMEWLLGGGIKVGVSANRESKTAKTLPEKLVEREEAVEEDFLKKRSSLTKIFQNGLKSLPNFNSTWNRSAATTNSTTNSSILAKTLKGSFNSIIPILFNVEEFWRDLDGLNGMILGYGNGFGVDTEEQGENWRKLVQQEATSVEARKAVDSAPRNEEVPLGMDEATGDFSFSLSTFSVSISPLSSSPPPSPPSSPTNPSRPVPPSRSSRRSRPASSDNNSPASRSPPIYRPYRLIANSKHLLQLTLEMEMMRRNKIVAPLRGRNVIVKMNPPFEVWNKIREDNEKFGGRGSSLKVELKPNHTITSGNNHIKNQRRGRDEDGVCEERRGRSRARRSSRRERD